MKVKILMVDDEPDVLDIIGRKLEAEGFVTCRAADGVEGLKKAREECPDLILLDIMMPNKDGFSMLSELQSEPESRNIPVVLVSAKSESDSLLDGRNLGAIDYLIKPIDFQQLLKLIRKYTLADSGA